MSTTALVFGALTIFGAAIVRGFAGFGFSLLAISALTLRFPVAEIVPAIFLLEIAASLHLLPSIWKDVRWRLLLPLIAGCLLATPIGAYALATFPAAPMQVALGVLVLVSVAVLWSGFALRSEPGPAATTLVGSGAGLLNGAFGIGGPPVIVFFFSTPTGTAAGRASLIAYFLATDAIGLANLAMHGLVTRSSMTMAAIFLPALVMGVWVGQRGFAAIDEARFRRLVLLLMALLGMLGILKPLL